MLIKAVYKGETNKKFKFCRRYKLDFQVCAKSFGSTKEVVNIAKYGDYEGKTETKYASLAKFLAEWLVVSR